MKHQASQSNKYYGLACRKFWNGDVDIITTTNKVKRSAFHASIVQGMWKNTPNSDSLPHPHFFFFDTKQERVLFINKLERKEIMNNEEMLKMAGIDLKELEEAKKSESFKILFDEKLGFIIFDPFNLLKSYSAFRDAEGWTYWSNEE